MKTYYFKDDQFKKKKITHTRKIVRAILLNEENKIAFIKIKGDDIFGHREYFETPGGGIKKGETRYQALQREIEEEVGVNIYNIKFIARVIDFYNLINRRNDNYFYLCRVKCKTEQHLEEYEKILMEGIVWFDIETAIEKYKTTVITPISKLVIQRELPILFLTKEYLTKYKY